MMKLRPYQQEDVEIMKTRASIGLFNEPRTGKTPTILTLLSELNTNAVIVAPASTLPALKTLASVWYQGTAQVVESTTPYADYPKLALVSYDTLRGRNGNSPVLTNLLKRPPGALVIDEAHRIKNRKSIQTKALLRLAPKVPRRFALTGTPAGSRPWEIFTILQFLFPKQYTNWGNFAHEWFICEDIPYNKYAFNILGWKPGAEQMFAQMLNLLSIQRKRADVMEWLPTIEPPTRIRLQPTPKQLAYLEELHKFYTAEHVITQNILESMMRERQILLHPGLLDLEGSSPKLAWLEDYLNDYPDKPILIFSRFTQWLKLLQKMKSSMGLITGKSKPSERQLLIDAFQSGKLSVLGIQIDAGKEGLTLDRAETIIFTDVSRPMSDIIQARDRMVATTESKAAVPKEIIELVMEGTYDEVLFDNIDKDYAETTAINDYKKHISKGGRHGI